jgi:hypothetical protein
MHVFAMGEGIEQAGVVGQMGHDAQLDLRVVGRNDAVSGWRDEGGADAAALGSTDRNVLQVGVA